VVRAVVFDFDGVILETEGPEYRAWEEIFRAHRARLTMEEWGAAIGTTGGFDPYRALLGRARGPVAGEDRVRAAQQARVDELLAASEPLPGVLTWLDAAARLDLSLAVASTSSADWVAGHLAVLGVAERFACLSCGDRETVPKPAPDLYLRACACLGVRPGAAVAVEDSAHGVAAATAAGLFTVAVPHALTRSMDLSRAQLLVSSLEEVSLSEVVALAEAWAGGAQG
jgi:HAD superfamily hydrolase (TIGR01509 family)